MRQQELHICQAVLGGALDFTKGQQEALQEWVKTNYPDLVPDAASETTPEEVPATLASSYYDTSRGFYDEAQQAAQTENPLAGMGGYVGGMTGPFGMSIGGGYGGVMGAAGPSNRSIAIQQGLRGRYHTAPPKTTWLDLNLSICIFKIQKRLLFLRGDIDHKLTICPKANRIKTTLAPPNREAYLNQISNYYGKSWNKADASTS